MAGTYPQRIEFTSKGPRAAAQPYTVVTPDGIPTVTMLPPEAPQRARPARTPQAQQDEAGRQAIALRGQLGPAYEVVADKNGKAVAGPRQVQIINTPARGAPITAQALDAMQPDTQLQKLPSITPQQRIMAFLDSALQQPRTIKEAQALTSMLPAPPKPVTNKDQLYGTAGQALSAQLATSIAAAKQAEAEGDAERARKITESATTAYFQRAAALLGASGLVMQGAPDPEGD